jgi:hypothetical protein
MKTLTTTLLLLVCLTAFGQFAPDTTQVGPNPTTVEEYNYLTKGYKVQVESGLDMKKGYSFQDMGQVKHGSYSFDIKGLIRDAKKELAGLLVVTKSDISGKSYYVCIPINNAELFAKYYADINAWDEALTTSYCYVVSAYFGQITASAFEMEKKVKK